MPNKKDDLHVKTNRSVKKKPREVVLLSGVKKGMSNLDISFQIQLMSILNTRIAFGLDPGVKVDFVQGRAKKYGVMELKIKGKDALRCFYSIDQPGLLLVAKVFLKKINGQPDNEIKLAVERIATYMQLKET